MRLYLAAFIVASALATVPGIGQAANPQQDRMKACNAQAAGMTWSARQTFMSSCLSGTHPNCTPGKSKPCGNSCISLDKTCHK
jgi:psiF repeat